MATDFKSRAGSDVSKEKSGLQTDESLDDDDDPLAEGSELLSDKSSELLS